MKRFYITRLISIGSLLSLGILPLHAQNQVQLAGQNTGGGQQSALPATLQVTGTTQAFSVSANRADVQDVLKMIFDQGQRQFSLDAGATGIVSMRLINQPLKAVLDAICAQSFLKYQLKNGVFVFSRDEDAVRRAITRLKDWNAQVRDQMRMLGLDVPPEANFYGRGGGMQGGQGGLGGGFSGGGRTSDANRSGYQNNYRMLQFPHGAQQLFNGVTAGRPQVQGSGAVGEKGEKGDSGKRVSKDGDVQRARSNDKSEALTKLDAGSTLAAPAGVNGNVGAPLAYDADGYSNLLKDNGLYSVNTQGAKVPVSDILMELGRQAGVTMLLDPNLAKDERFRLKGTTPPRTFEEQLNLLAVYTRLEWRKIGGNAILVSPTPEFQLFFGTDPLPKLSYPSAQNASRRKGTEQPADQKPDLKKESGEKKPEPDKDKPKDGKGN